MLWAVMLLGVTTALCDRAAAQPQAAYAHLGDTLPPPTAEPYPTTSVVVSAIDPPELVAPAPVPASQPVPPDDEPLLPVLEPEEVIEPTAVHWYSPRYWLQPPGWDTSLEVGLNGASGTSESLSVRAGGYSKFENDRRKVKVELYHNRTNAEGVDTQNNAKLDARHDWLLGESPWTIYALSQLFYDEFQAFDVNLNMNAGFGYKLVDSEQLKISGTVGSGASREFGGPDDEWVPEAQFGWEYEHQLVEHQRFYAKMDYFPEFTDFGTYRLLTDIGWEIELLQPSNMSLKISATDRYDSEPQGVNPHILNYSVLLLWKL